MRDMIKPLVILTVVCIVYPFVEMVIVSFWKSLRNYLMKRTNSSSINRRSH